MSDKLLSVRVPESLLDRIEEVRGDEKRSEWVRRVLEDAANPKARNEPRIKPKPVAPDRVDQSAKPVTVRRRDADAEALLSHVREGPRHLRNLPDEMGWMPMRVDRVLGRLGNAVRFQDGMVVASEG